MTREGSGPPPPNTHNAPVPRARLPPSVLLSQCLAKIAARAPDRTLPHGTRAVAAALGEQIRRHPSPSLCLIVLPELPRVFFCFLRTRGARSGISIQSISRLPPQYGSTHANSITRQFHQIPQAPARTTILASNPPRPRIQVLSRFGRWMAGGGGRYKATLEHEDHSHGQYIQASQYIPEIHSWATKSVPLGGGIIRSLNFSFFCFPCICNEKGDTYFYLPCDP